MDAVFRRLWTTCLRPEQAGGSLAAQKRAWARFWASMASCTILETHLIIIIIFFFGWFGQWMWMGNLRISHSKSQTVLHTPTLAQAPPLVHRQGSAPGGAVSWRQHSAPTRHPPRPRLARVAESAFSASRQRIFFSSDSCFGMAPCCRCCSCSWPYSCTAGHRVLVGAWRVRMGNSMGNNTSTRSFPHSTHSNNFR